MKSDLTEKELLSLHRGFYIFGDQFVLKILFELERYGEKNFTELKSSLGINPATLTKKLRLLVKSGVISTDRTRDGKRVYYFLSIRHRQLKRFIDSLERLSSELSRSGQ